MTDREAMKQSGKRGNGMTDRELLELAAKAAEIKGEYREVFNGFVVDTAPFRDFVVWRPHTDDGAFVPEHVFYRYYKQYIKPSGRKSRWWQ